MTEEAYLEELQGRLRWLLMWNEDQLPTTTVEFVWELIDVNECGLALEVLSDMLVESEARIDGESFEMVVLLAGEMDLDGVVVEQLRPLLRPSH